MRRVMLGGFVALVLVAGACGGDDDTKDGEDTESGEESSGSGGGNGTSDEYVAAYAEALGVLGTSEEESSCMAGAIVDTVGADRLNEVTSPDDVSRSSFDPAALGLDTTEAEALYDGLDGCADLLELMVSASGAPGVADCLREHLDESTVKAILVASFSGETDGMADAQTRLSDAYTSCSPTDSLPVPTTVATG